MVASSFSYILKTYDRNSILTRCPRPLLPASRIVKPDYEATCAAEGLEPGVQHAIVQIDVYSVHRGAPFRQFMRERYPHMHLVFIPAGCTGVAQVADTILNR